MDWEWRWGARKAEKNRWWSKAYIRVVVEVRRGARRRRMREVSILVFAFVVEEGRVCAG